MSRRECFATKSCWLGGLQRPRKSHYGGEMITAFVLIDAWPQRIDGLGGDLAKIDGVDEVHSVAGSGVAMVAMLRVDSHNDIATVVTQDISQLSGVRSTQTLIGFRQYSPEEMDATPDID